METKTVPIHKILPKQRNWTAKVEVLEKSFPRISQSSRLYQRLILGDAEGTRVEAAIFGADIELFQDTLKECKKYYISNALVRANLYPQKLISNEYQWVINGATLVEEVTNVQEAELTKFSFIPLKELSNFTHASCVVDIIAAAIQVYPRRQIRTRYGETTIQEMLLLTDELRAIKLTAWDQFVDNECHAISNIIDSWPIIAGKRLKVSTFGGGLSLSTRSSSCLMIDPTMPEAASLRAWCIQHKGEIITYLTETADQLPCSSASVPTAENTFTTSTLAHVQVTDKFWLKATASITNFTQKFWYVGCSRCFKAIHVECGRIYTCHHCKEPNVTAEPRCRFDVQLDDKDGYIVANCFGIHANTLFKITGEDLRKHTNENGITEREYLEKLPKTNTQLLLLKPYDWKGQQWFTILTSINAEETTTTPAPAE